MRDSASPMLNRGVPPEEFEQIVRRYVAGWVSPNRRPYTGNLFPLPRAYLRVYPRRVLSAPMQPPIDSSLTDGKDAGNGHAVEELLRLSERDFELIVSRKSSGHGASRRTSSHPVRCRRTSAEV